MPGFDAQEYRRLIDGFLPRPIRTEAQLEATEQQIDELLTVSERTTAQDEYLELLSDLVRDWEAEHVQIPAVSGVDVVSSCVSNMALLSERSCTKDYPKGCGGDGPANDNPRVVLSS